MQIWQCCGTFRLLLLMTVNESSIGYTTSQRGVSLCEADVTDEGKRGRKTGNENRHVSAVSDDSSLGTRI
jgi:hypothetical protein